MVVVKLSTPVFETKVPDSLLGLPDAWLAVAIVEAPGLADSDAVALVRRADEAESIGRDRWALALALPLGGVLPCTLLRFGASSLQRPAVCCVRRSLLLLEHCKRLLLHGFRAALMRLQKPPLGVQC